MDNYQPNPVLSVDSNSESLAPKTQNERVLRRLTDHANAWVSMPELAKACTVSGIGVPVHSRISDLREVGFVIEHKNEWVKRQCHSFYRLVNLPQKNA